MIQSRATLSSALARGNAALSRRRGAARARLLDQESGRIAILSVLTLASSAARPERPNGSGPERVIRTDQLWQLLPRSAPASMLQSTLLLGVATGSRASATQALELP